MSKISGKYERMELGVARISAPQSIAQISDENYLQIKKRGGIDERFTVN